MRQEMRQLLTPRMIQSMEILQLPLMALEERIEQEIQNNPVLELRENEALPAGEPTAEVDALVELAPAIAECTGNAGRYDRPSKIRSKVRSKV